MSDLNLQLVREFFELNQFYVLPHWRYGDLSKMQDGASLLFVERPRANTVSDPEFLLRPPDLDGIRRAVVEVRAWHGDRLYPFTVESNPVFGRVATPEIRELAETIFETDEFTTILVVSELAVSHGPRARALQMLRDMRVGHVMEFPAILGDLLARVDVYGNYAPSQTLQTMRLLKRYGFVRRQQMELPFAMEDGGED